MKSSRLFFLLILFIINCFILVWLIQDRSHASGLTATICNSDEFREQFLPPSLYKELSETSDFGHPFAELLTTTMLDGHFHPKNCLHKHGALSEIQKRRISASEKML